MFVSYWAARLAAWLPPSPARAPRPDPSVSGAGRGISLVIPSRNGRDLLSAQLPGIVRDLPPNSETIVVDNGSSDGTAEFLRASYPAVIVESSAEPLGFARAVNRGIARSRYSHVCLLNNDMLIEPGFFAALQAAFHQVPDLFCATAQIHFPPGIRREETGKAVIRKESPLDFPVRCDDPLPGEDLTWVLYGSGGCSLYDTEKLRSLGCIDEVYDPAYVEDLDIGYRAWLRDWPSVYVAGAAVEHRHRATTSRYFSEDELADLLEINYLKFLARAVQNRKLYLRLWREALDRLRSLRRATPLKAAAGIARRASHKPAPPEPEELLLALTDGSVACFPGTGAEPPLVIAVDRLAPPPADFLSRHRQIVVVRGTKDSLAYRAACKLAR